MSNPIDEKEIQKKKFNSSVAKGKEERGTILVITGNGKGKTTSGFGVVARAVGHGYKAAVAQFIKGKWACGERDLLEKEGVPFSVMGTGFTWNSKDKEADIAAAKAVWNQMKGYLKDPDYHVVLLDELTYMLSYGYLDTKDVIDTIVNKPLNQSVIITGRNACDELIEAADTVSEIKDIKHAFKGGIKARKGIDW